MQLRSKKCVADVIGSRQRHAAHNPVATFECIMEQVGDCSAGMDA